MKKYAVYLPQFHEIPENNEWWGNGFTEWNNVRCAKPLFKGHDQPKIPLNDNYYDLMDLETVRWQTKLLHEYKLDGFMYYHYYFNGRLLLEKPAENLLKNKDIDQHFFFIWANHSWIRSWEGTKELLLEQTYGEQEDLEKHFQYLLPFFKDDRYEKENMCPMFGIFNIDIPNKEEMFQYFDKRCKEEGFNGIYLIESYGADSRRDFPKDYFKVLDRFSSLTNAVYIRQPAFFEFELRKGIAKIAYTYYRRFMRSKHNVFKVVPKLDGNKLVDKFLKVKIPDTKYEMISSFLFEWDNTPRHKYRGYIITPVDKEHFMRYMDHIKDSKFVFFNAWNEWAEGMILEPTEKNGYKYLEWIREWSLKNE